jgi:hypothetical protein
MPRSRIVPLPTGRPIASHRLHESVLVVPRRRCAVLRARSPRETARAAERKGAIERHGSPKSVPPASVTQTTSSISVWSRSRPCSTDSLQGAAAAEDQAAEAAETGWLSRPEVSVQGDRRGVLNSSMTPRHAISWTFSASGWPAAALRSRRARPPRWRSHASQYARGRPPRPRASPRAPSPRRGPRRGWPCRRAR